MASDVFSSIDSGKRPATSSTATEIRALTVKVFGRRSNGSPVPLDDFKFIINRNNIGDPQLGVPADQIDESKIPSINPPASHSPVVTVGDSANPVVYVPDGSYLVSARAPGYKLGGNWVTVDGSDAEVVVELLPHPLPLSKIRAFVFHDNQPVNGEPDLPSETGLEGFRIIIEDAVGELTVDYFGNPLGTQYQKDGHGNIIFDADGKPVPIPNTGGVILSDAEGYAVVENIPPGKYGVQAIPPDGTDWVQTTTIEGTHVIDAWVEEGNDGYVDEFFYRFPLVWFGFVRPMEFPAPQPGETRGFIRGQVRTVLEFEAPNVPILMGEPVKRPWIALTDIGGNDQQVYLGRGEENGSFYIKNVLPGLYQMAVWDEFLDYIISFRTVQVPGPNGSWDVVVEDDPVNYPGQIAIPRWYGWIKGKVFMDNNENGIPDPGEKGIPFTGVLTRFKDASIQYATITDSEGNYNFNEVFELERFTVAEVSFTRLARTGVAANPEGRYPVPEVFDGALTAAVLTWAGSTNYIDFGKRTYKPGENGGITGIVYYATMRNEFDPRYAAAEDYEPGIPGVTVNLYQKNDDGTLILINTVETDAWTHPTGCVPPYGPEDPRCIEKPSLGNQVRPGVFDGGYAFEEKWILDENYRPVTDPDTGEYLTEPLPAGTYYVEAVPQADYNNPLPDGGPRPLYRVVAEESVNTDQGDRYVMNTDFPFEENGEPVCPETKPVPESRAWIPAPPCAGKLHKVQDPRSPYDGEYRPLCNMKEVILGNGENAAADFFLYTDVPIPGRILGLLSDDVNIETDPNLIFYGDKRGIPHTPVGIRDYNGRLITTVYSDKNGIFEVLLPSTYTANVPTPSGLVPHMYRVVGNDPGDPGQPNLNYNPNYQTLNLVFDVWPGKTTYADVALFPITAFVAHSGSQFARPPQCNVERGIPQIFRVDRVVVTGQERIITLTGLDFGTAQGGGRVTINGDDSHVEVLAWNNTSITVKILPSIVSDQGGTGQLLVTGDNGEVSPTGITIHVLGSVYNPRVLHVKQDGTGDYATIQEAVNAAAGETLIVVHPGTYYENPILYSRQTGGPIKRLKLQGMGPGGINPDGPDGNPVAVEGSTIDGRFFLTDPAPWRNLLSTIDYDYIDTPDIYEGQAMTVLAKDGDLDMQFSSLIDGFSIINARGNGAGGIYVNAYCRYLEISNNIMQSNSGGFGGAVTIGKPYAGSNHNENIRIHHNRILNNGGLNLAGGIGVFNGADNYEIDHNKICGNYSAEYGGGISHYGLSHNGSIHHNCILFNASFDEGAGILVGGELPKPPGELSPGSGSVSIYNNLIQGNLANDDGGGIRLLQPTTYEIKIYNNMIVNNVSTDLGGGIALDDASNVIIYNNTIAKNISTATAEDSDRSPHGAGLVSEVHSTAFRAVLPPGSPDFSDPVLFNNIFWDNRAYYFDLQTLQLAEGGVMDLEVFGTSGTFSPHYCSLTEEYPGGGNNLVANPAFVQQYDTTVRAATFAAQPDFKSVIIVTAVPELEGDYHLTGGSPVIGRGTGSFEGYSTPTDDFDGDSRGPGIDIGADQYRE
ncbi:SdrD B-like domain-containing protein [Desulfoscipio geothermicus]|uniref:Right handed beta helix region n=1 Tax=Desulfoscipio geothermicus DSM 3669 TaxID=1121426 RepID=A0A1I6DZK0_9FIRM|nr:SdrD B-like domain-containing protein [Desulfoscipio geothermicus]SFR10863.1 Right handed beta helix region [Desulfoscipio geothermicus DSM 3669]